MTSRLHYRFLYCNLATILLVSIILQASLLRTLIGVTAGFLVALFFSHVVKRQVVAPLEDVSIALQKMSAGDLKHRVAIAGDEQLAMMGYNLSAIAQTLNSTLVELTEGKQKVESLVGAMGEGVMVLDSRGRIALTNRALLTMIGTSRDLGGKTPLDIFRNPALDTSVRDALSGGTPGVVEIGVSTGRILEAHVSGVLNLAGVIDSALIVFHDLTEVRRTERMRRDFVANVSHEFKTPLTAIRGYTETLLSGSVEDAKIETDFLRTVERNARHLETLVSDLLMLARLEAELPASLDTVNVKSLVDEQITSRRGIIAERKIRVVADCPPIELRADRGRLSAAISNLIDNAVYYNHTAGEIQISGVQDNGTFVLSIADTGEGIPPAEIPRIFERFYRVDKARSRESGGTGLGLAIVKHAIESQGGSVSVSSKLGSGSKFSIRLPIRE